MKECFRVFSLLDNGSGEWGLGRTYLGTSHLKRFDHTTITRFGGSKKTFFVWAIGVGGWNNHLQIRFFGSWKSSKACIPFFASWRSSKRWIEFFASGRSWKASFQIFSNRKNSKNTQEAQNHDLNSLQAENAQNHEFNFL